jgi:hypothetical protein
MTLPPAPSAESTRRWTLHAVEGSVVDAAQAKEGGQPDFWLQWLDPLDRAIVWARAQGVRWKTICWQFGISRATAYRRYRYGITVITCRLNGDLRNRSRRQVLNEV